MFEENFEKEARIFTGLLVIIFILIFGRLWQLQLLEHSTYSRLARENAARTIPFIAPRGIIYDRYGKVLVSNRAIFSAYLLPQSIDPSNVNDQIKKLSGLLGISETEIASKIQKFKDSPFEPIILKKNLSLTMITKLEERRDEYPGIVVRTQPVRRYPHGRLGVHFLGYVGEVTKDELKNLGSLGYEIGDIIGKDGVEASYDNYLRGVDGGQQVEVDVYGNPVRTTKSLDPVPGKDIVLTIDLELQKVVEDALKDKEGAVVVIDPRNGEILAMASSPDYDPNIFAELMEQKEWEALDKRNHPFMNRAISVYPPGSTFKVVTLSSTLMENTASLSEVINCNGFFKLGNRVAKCWKEGGHGELNILEGLVWSCDVVFFELGLRNGVDLLSKYAKEYGLGTRAGVDLPGEADGFIPTGDWKQNKFNEPWVKGDSINMAIGQGFVQVTPLQMAILYGGIGVGKRYKPFIVKNVVDRDGTLIYSAEAQELGGIPIEGKNLELLRSALRAVIVRGTGLAAKVQGIPAAGKTGTAENPGKAHAWFMCYAPYDKPEIAIATFVVHGEHGDHVTAYIARDILTWYKKNRLKTVYDEPNFNWDQYIMHGPYKGTLYKQ